MLRLPLLQEGRDAGHSDGQGLGGNPGPAAPEVARPLRLARGTCTHTHKRSRPSMFCAAHTAWALATHTMHTTWEVAVHDGYIIQAESC